MPKKKKEPKEVKKEVEKKPIDKPNTATPPIIETTATPAKTPQIEIAPAPDERLNFLYALAETLRVEGITRISDLENKIAQELNK